MSGADHVQAATDAARNLARSKHPEVVNLCRAYLEKAGEVTALREKLREVLGRVDEVILDLDDEERDVPATEAGG